MNIQKTNLLVLDNKFKMKDKPTAPVENPIDQPSTAKDGMKALMFQGQQNFLNNQVAFQGGMKQRVATYAAIGLMTAAATGLTSCVKQNVDVDLAALQAAQSETNALLRELLAQHKIDQEMYNKMLTAINNVSAQVQAGNVSLEDFKTEVFKYIAFDKNIQQQILTELQNQGMNQEEANAFLTESINQIIIMLRNGQMSLDDAIEALNGIKNGVDNIAAILEKFYSAWAEANTKAEADRAKLIDFAEKTYINTNTLVEQGKQYLVNDSVKIANQEEMLKKMDGLQASVNYLNYLTQMLLAQGYTQMQINQMNFNQMLAAVKEGNKIEKQNYETLKNLFALIEKQGYVSEEQRAQIIELLKNIDANVSAILDTVNNLYKAYLDEAKKNDAFRANMIVNGAINNQLLTRIMIDGQYRNKLLYENNKTLLNMSIKLDQTNKKLDSLVVLGNEKPAELVEVINKAITKGDEIVTSIKDIHVNMNADEIVAAIKEFQNTYVLTEAQKIDLQKEANTLLATYLPLLKGQSSDNAPVLAKLEELAKLIKENTAAVNNNTMSAADASAKELEAQKEANELLKKLIAKADAILAKMDANAEAAQNYYNNMEAKFGEINGLIPNLEARLNTIIAKMNTIVKQGEDLKPVIDEILVEVKNLEGIAGKALTKDELDQVLNKYGDDLKALLNALHADTAADLDKINKNIEKGNQIKQEILDEIKKHKDEPEILAQIKHILETRDFCHCTCTDKDVNNNEGILDEIKGITG